MNLSVAGPRSISTSTSRSTSTDKVCHDEENNNKENDVPDNKDSCEEKKEADQPARIIPWRAQLRKTNSKLNLLE